MHVQGYFEESSPTTDDGTAILWIDGIKYINEVQTFRTRTSSTTFWNQLLIGYYLGHGADGQCAAYGDAYTYWDNVYIDTTQARVEIGDAPIYTNTSHREIQIPIVWSSNSITITTQLGSFISGQTAYFYVFDANGNVNANGFPVTIE